MKKRLNVDQIQSELRGGSAFFPGYQGVVDSPAQETERPTQNQDSEKQGVLPSVPLGVPRPGPLIPKRAKRPIRQRQPFDIYEDQYQSLKKIADTEKDFVNGRGMSQMVREAIDNYLRDHAIPEK
jgi:hypothetical protein